jgi:hypothetical protein
MLIITNISNKKHFNFFFQTQLTALINNDKFLKYLLILLKKKIM